MMLTTQGFAAPTWPVVFITIAMGLTGNAVADDWIGEVVELGHKRCDFPPNGNLAELAPAYYEPKDLSEDQKIKILLDGLHSEKTAKRRLCCLKILVERFPLTAAKEIESIAFNGSLDLEIRKRAIWVAGFMREEKSIVWLEKLLASMEPSIREASMDALGFCLFPHFVEKFVARDFNDPLGVKISGEISIHVGNAYSFGVTNRKLLAGMDNWQAAQFLTRGRFNTKKTPPKRGDQATRLRIANKLTKVMTTGRTRHERMAAARALAGYKPKDYKLRVAEWGVWIESQGKLQLARTVLDEIPPVAYQTTKQIAELNQRVNQIMIVTKPIIHLKVDRPLAVNVSAFLCKGQPWFTFPRPSCFDIKVVENVRVRSFSDSDFQQSKNVVKASSQKWKHFGEQAHQGYPFLLPKASKVGGYAGGFGRGGNQIQAIGVTWQHLIVSPKQLGWMFEPVIAKDYQWWTNLRKVDSSWISNGFESEKFLYYDGPTLLPSPIRIEYSGKGKDRELLFRYFGVLVKPDPMRVPPQFLDKPIGMMVEVKDGKMRARQLEFDYELKERKLVYKVKQEINVGDLTLLTAKHVEKNGYDLNGKDEVQKAFFAMLKKDDGLSNAEANGLFQAWEKQFFQTNGKRLIVRMRTPDYDFQCPLKVTPKPTHVSRVGLILSELEN